MASEDTPLQVPVEMGVLGNDADATGSPLSAVLVAAPQHGKLTLNGDGSFTYTPAANFAGLDGFVYKATDGIVESNVASVSLTVTEVNDTPRRTVGAVTGITVQPRSGATSLGLESFSYGPGGGSGESGQVLKYKCTRLPAATLGNVVLGDGVTAVRANTFYSLSQIRGMKFRTASAGLAGTTYFQYTVTDNGTTAGELAPKTLTQSIPIRIVLPSTTQASVASKTGVASADSPSPSAENRGASCHALHDAALSIASESPRERAKTTADVNCWTWC